MAASNLAIRLATAAVMVPLLLALLFWGPAWGWLLFILLASAVGAVELFGMSHPGDGIMRGAGVLLTWAIVLAIWYHAVLPQALVTVFIVVPYLSFLLTLWRLGTIPTAALRIAMSCFGPMWLGAGFGAIATIRVVGEPDGAAFVVLCLVLSWMSDTGGYFAGRAFGKHKLYEAVSPKKTVEGAIGGVVAVILSALVTRFLVLESLSIRDAVILGAVGSVAGMFGDLGESLLKRSVGVKDSGGIVPGHGGMLDRVDATLVTAPIVLLYLVWFR